MPELSPTLCNQQKLLNAISNVQEEPSIESWQALQSAANLVNQFAVEELTELKSDLAELTSSAMNLSLPIDDEDGEELVTHRLCELNYEIEARAQSFIELNAIRLDAQYELNRARQALAPQHS
ncbi:hypothetical protein [Photobacterium sanguinicancri]|uniref:hypothetical protein n=1 Tax=Photobacterium sanguinicancri TaxID=875932 RepID=UPI000786A87F|nr:hypothetical protein [Photobacterium sanguinicancri]KXI21088.1 hypothetical protein AS132_20645 [Photobacterium sanguinicancri]